MDLRESVRLSWRAISDHPLRSVLTTIGVVIGVAAVITFVSFGASLQAGIVGDITDDQSPAVAATASPDRLSAPPGENTVPAFTEHDVARLENESSVASVAPLGTISTSSITREDETLAWQSVTATTPAYFEDREFEEGEAFEQESAEMVVNRPFSKLFDPALSPGDTVVVRDGDGREVQMTVVGVVEARPGPFGTPPSARAFVPTKPFYRVTTESPTTGERQRVYEEVVVVAEGFDSVPAVQSAAETYLTEESDARELKPDAYAIDVRTNQELVDKIEEVIRTFTAFVASVAVISLVVGSIGIANIMLVSVSERTREIGIMKAIGARRGDIVQLFLVEAIVLGVFGSLVGVLVGLLGGHAAAAYVGLPTTIQWEWAAIAVVVGVGVGIVSGIYPAWNAARIDPIDALRRE